MKLWSIDRDYMGYDEKIGNERISDFFNLRNVTMLNLPNVKLHLPKYYSKKRGSQDLARIHHSEQ